EGALAARGRRQPIRRARVCRTGAELLAHPVENRPIHRLPIDVGSRTRLAIHGARPPVEHAFARLWIELVPSGQHRLEHVGGSPRRLVEVQRFAETDDELDALERPETLGIDSPETLAGVRHIPRRAPLTLPL